MDKTNKLLLLAIVISVMLAAIPYQFGSNITKSTHAELVTAIYKVSNQCIADHYSHLLTEDGYVVSEQPIRNDCEAEHLFDFVRVIKPNQTDKETKNISIELHDTVVEYNGNATFMKSLKLIDGDTGEFIEDLTDKFMESVMESQSSTNI